MAASVVYTVWDGQIVSESRGGVESDYVPDPLGNTVALVNSSHAITDTWTYWPYGEIGVHNGSSITPFTFLGSLGYFLDAITQLYVRARLLRADVVRWLTVDRAWPAQSKYGYVGTKPSFRVDPSGRAAAATCQRPNPCSQIPDKLSGACISLGCSFNSVKEMIDYIKKLIGITNLPGWIKELIADIGKPPDWSPDDCCKKAASGSAGPIWSPLKPKEINIPALIAWLCQAAKSGSGVGVCAAIYKTDTAPCESCCSQTFPSNPTLQEHCTEACAGAHD